MPNLVRLHLAGEADRLPVPLPFRNFIAQARLGVSREAHETFFRELLGGVTDSIYFKLNSLAMSSGINP